MANKLTPQEAAERAARFAANENPEYRAASRAIESARLAHSAAYEVSAVEMARALAADPAYQIADAARAQAEIALADAKCNAAKIYRRLIGAA